MADLLDTSSTPEPTDAVVVDSSAPAEASMPTPERIAELVAQSRAASKDLTLDTDAAPQDAPATPADGTPAPTTPATPAPEATAFDEAAFVGSKFGDKYKSAEEVAAELAQVETLKANQISDDNRATLALLSDAKVRKEYLKLVDADYSTFTPEKKIKENFLRKNSQYSAEEAELRFEDYMAQHFAAAVGVDPTHPEFEETPEYVKAMKLMGFQAERDEVELNEYRDQKTAELLKGALPAAVPADTPVVEDEATKAAREEKAAAYLAEVDTFVGEGLDLMVELPDGTKAAIGAGVTPEETKAVKEVLLNLGPSIERFVFPDGKTQSMENAAILAAVMTHGMKLFSNAIQVGRDSVPPHVTLDGLTNAGGTAAAPAENITVEEAMRRTRAAASAR